jgi:3-keto-disaccharide hydrolase
MSLRAFRFLAAAVVLSIGWIGRPWLAQTSAEPNPQSGASVAEAQFVPGQWVQLFNGHDLDHWIVKLNHHDMGDNFGDTFRVKDGILQVRYDKYDDFGDQFGHLFYDRPFSHYHLAVEYRFVGKLHRGARDYADMNSGVMLHAQDPRTILRDQNWPIAIELQFLAGLGDGRPRATGNACTPGTDVFYNGQLRHDHIIPSTAKTYAPDEWVRAEAIVHGNDSFTHIINGEKVLEYSRPQIGGGVVEGYDPAVFVDGKPLKEGYIALQSEGQPVDFRKVELMVLEPNAAGEPAMQ